MKPITASFLLCTLLAPLLLTAVWRQCHRWQVRQAVKQGLLSDVHNPNLLWLMLPAREAEKLRWEGQHEFEFRGTMYDLIRKERTGDTLRLLCWPDHLETGLGKQLDQLLSNHPDPQQQHRHLSLQDYLKSLPFISFASQTAEILFAEGSISFSHGSLKGRLAPAPPSPPPQS